MAGAFENGWLSFERHAGKAHLRVPDSIQLSGKSNLALISLSNIKLIEVKRRAGASFGRSGLLELLGDRICFGMVSGDTNTGDGRITTECARWDAVRLMRTGNRQAC